VGVADLDVYALVSGTEAAEYAGVSVAAVCNWNARGYLPVATDGDGGEIRDSRGRPRYRLLDVAKAEHAADANRRGVRKRQAA
jgi:hypothetical protein